MRKVFLIVIFIVFAGCGLREEFQLSGKTMGTTYHIKVVTWWFKNLGDLELQIKNRLQEINRSMSTYSHDSEISRFNSIKKTEEKFYVSDDFYRVLLVAREIHQMTGGAWDGTVMPLIELWGFSRSDNGIYEMRADIPGRKSIRKALSKIGFEKIEISEQKYLKKKQASVSLDFASIAKGYAVDQVSGLIKQRRIDDFLVEIGGEVYASGYRLDGQCWRVGVNTPRKDAAYDQVHEIIDITDKALATSGDYRNFFEIDGKYYSHILDPKTGFPVSNGVVSVSILADTCVFADGLATGVMVMGKEKGLKLINKLEGVECLIITMGKEGKLANYYSNGLKPIK